MAKASKVLPGFAGGNMATSVVNGLASQAMSNNQDKAYKKAMKQQKKLAKEELAAAQKKEDIARREHIDDLSKGVDLSAILRESASSVISNPVGATRDSVEDAISLG